MLSFNSISKSFLFVTMKNRKFGWWNLGEISVPKGTSSMDGLYICTYV